MIRTNRAVCIHCLRGRRVTRDHVLPKSWYPDGMPGHVQRWTAPSCAQCNSALGKMENELKIRLGFCIDPDNSSARGLYQASLRAIDPSAGKNGKDARGRLKLQRKILSELTPGSSELMESCLEGFGPAVGYQVEELIAVPIPKKLVDRVCEKMIRGFYYTLADGACIDNSRYEILSHQIRDGAALDIDQIINENPGHFENEIPPVMTVAGVFVHDDPMNTIMRIKIWDQWVWYSTVTEREH